MGNPSFVLEAGQGIFIDVPYDPNNKRITIVLTVDMLTGQGRDRRRLKAFYNNKNANITRRPLEDKVKNEFSNKR